MQIYRKITFFFFTMLLNVSIRAEVTGEKLMIGAFSSRSLDHWESKKFKGQTTYQLVDLAGTRVLKAESVDSASGLFNGQRIDLQKTPVMNWCWRIEKRNILADLKQQFGEDIRYIDAVAIMTDTDNAQGIVMAYYGDIYFSKN